MSSTGPSRSSFRLGDALQATFSSASSNFVTFFLLSVLLYSVPQLVVGLGFSTPGLAPVGSAAPAAGLAALAASSLVTFITNVLLQGAFARGVVTHLNGGRASLGQCLQAASTVIVPLLAISILATLGAVAGFLLLFVPGLFLLLVWSMVAPVEVVERVGVFAAFGRSVALTRGHRWAILAVFIVVWVVAAVIGGVVAVVAGMAGAAGGAMLGASLAAGLVAMLVQALGGAIGMVFTGAAPGAIYFELRRAKEGAAPSELAAVFD